MKKQYFITTTNLRPRVYYRLTDNWVELTVRFVTGEHGSREIKDAISRDILDAFEQAGPGIASATFEITGLPPLRIEDGAPLKAGQPTRPGKE